MKALKSQREFEVTRKKLRGLEELVAKTEAEPAESSYARELTLRSLRRTINQLKEEITRFQAGSGSAASGD
jgi:hypothetical protein